MAGTVVAVEVAVGQEVSAGAALAIVEAMKMHHPLRAQHAGRVDAIHIKPGDVIAADDIVILLDPTGGGAESAVEQQQVDLDEIRPDLAALRDRRGKLLDEKRPEAVASRHDRGMRTARENIADLTDGGLLVEYGGLAVAAQRGRRPLDEWRPRRRPTGSSPASAGSTQRCSRRTARPAPSWPTTTRSWPAPRAISATARPTECWNRCGCNASAGAVRRGRRRPSRRHRRTDRRRPALHHLRRDGRAQRRRCPLVGSSPGAASPATPPCSARAT